MIYSDHDIRRITTANAFAAGQTYQRQGRVLSIEHEGDGQISATVRGSEPTPYAQTIVLKRQASGAVRIEGHCTCPVGFNCKHVAAALFEDLRNPGTAGQRRPAAVLHPIPMPARASSVPAPSGLPPDLMGWLDGLDRAQATADETYPAGLAQRLVYVVAPAAQGRRMPHLGVAAISTRLLKDGRFAEGGRAYAPETAVPGGGAKFLRPSDFRIMAALARLRQGYGTASHVLSRETGADILAEILATGRARWLDVNGPVLVPGEPRDGRIAWRPDGDDAMRPMLEAGEGVVVLNAMPPVYVDPAAGRIGPVDAGLQPKLACALLDAPPVAVDLIAALNEKMAWRMPALAELRPPEPGPSQVVDAAPVPHLRLFAADLPAVPSYGGYRGYFVSEMPKEEVALARLGFDYGPVHVAAGETRPRLTRLQDGARLEVRRDLGAEQVHREALARLGFVPAPELRPNLPKAFVHDLLVDGDELAWLDLIYSDLPQLTAAGWRIEVAEDFPYRIVRADGDFDAKISEGSGIDWFELDLGVMIDGERVDLIGPIVSLISRAAIDVAGLQDRLTEDDVFYLRLDDGRVLGLPLARIVPIVAAIEELAAGGTLGDGRLRLTAADAVALAAFEEAARSAGVVWQGGEALRQMGRKLGTAGGIPPVALPEDFAATLRPYQAEGVAWLAFLREVGFGGVLADDMGLGKTVQALALVAIEKAAGRLDRPALVVAPTSLMANWRLEAERFAPGLRVLTLHGLDRKARFAAIGASDLVLTTYPLIARDHEVLAREPWHIVILDEAQTIKNPEATTTKLVLGLEARHRFCLSGTPLENHLGELWSLFAFVMPGFLGDQQAFRRRWRTPIEKQGDAARGRLLARRVKPFLLRRTKEQVARDLPPKTEIVERIEFGQAQRDLYESIRLSMHKRVRDAVARKGFAQSRIIILDALLKLRQACCDPRLLKLDSAAARRATSAKLERLEEMLAELVAENRRILVFSQFTSMLDLIRPRLDAMDLPYALLTGRTRDRETEIRRFQDGGMPIFLVSLKAGGTGLNLTAADTVVLYDPWWNPAVEEQAIDRAHRIGQDKPVFVHKLVATATIEEKMETLKDKKRALAESLFDHDGAPTLAMTEADLDLLFAEA